MSVAVTTLAEAEQRFALTRSEDAQFFLEWSTDLPQLTDAEKNGLTELRRRYLYQRSEGHLLEGTVTLLFASPLITLAGFYDPPFKVRAEESVQLGHNTASHGYLPPSLPTQNFIVCCKS